MDKARILEERRAEKIRAEGFLKELSEKEKNQAFCRLILNLRAHFACVNI